MTLGRSAILPEKQKVRIRWRTACGTLVAGGLRSDRRGRSPLRGLSPRLEVRLLHGLASRRGFRFLLHPNGALGERGIDAAAVECRLEALADLACGGELLTRLDLEDRTDRDRRVPEGLDTPYLGLLEHRGVLQLGVPHRAGG